MPMKEADQIILDIKRKIFKPVYFLCGEEPYYIDLVSNYIEQHAIDESEKEFNQTVIYGKDLELGSILGLAKEFPMMSDYRVVLIKEAQNIKELGKKSSTDSEPEKNVESANKVTQAFLSYIQQPQKSTILVFCYKYKTLDKRSAIAKAIIKNSVYLETKKIYDNKLPEWIADYVKNKKLTINPKASFMLAEFLGNDLSKISNEIDKLILNLKEVAEITAELVQEYVGISKDYNVFELQSALGNKEILKVNQIINYFSANEKDHPMVMTLSSLYNYFIKVFRYHFLTDKSKFAAAQALGVNPFFVESYAKAAGKYPPVKLKQIFYALKEYDLKSKGVNNSTVPSGELLKELMFKILH